MTNRLFVFNEAVGSHTLPKMLDIKTIFTNCYILFSEPCQLPSDLSDSGFKAIRSRSSPSCFERNKTSKLTLNVGGSCGRKSLIRAAAPALFLQTENTPRCHNTTVLKNKKSHLLLLYRAWFFFLLSFLFSTQERHKIFHMGPDTRHRPHTFQLRPRHNIWWCCEGFGTLGGVATVKQQEVGEGGIGRRRGRQGRGVKKQRGRGEREEDGGKEGRK